MKGCGPVQNFSRRAGWYAAYLLRRAMRALISESVTQPLVIWDLDSACSALGLPLFNFSVSGADDSVHFMGL